jgi:S1-C subfamily serine protease
VESLNTTDKIITGLLPKDVIVEAEGEKVNAAFDLISIYEKINWTGKMALTIYRNQQKQQLVFRFK